MLQLRSCSSSARQSQSSKAKECKSFETFPWVGQGYPQMSLGQSWTNLECPDNIRSPARHEPGSQVGIWSNSCNDVKCFPNMTFQLWFCKKSCLGIELKKIKLINTLETSRSKNIEWDENCKKYLICRIIYQFFLHSFDCLFCLCCFALACFDCHRQRCI